ncbi:MAG: hypothetical protein KJN99_14130 [Marinicaulis sp.]|nr:hypothetical protein [Marinicaulis sp.]
MSDATLAATEVTGNARMRRRPVWRRASKRKELLTWAPYGVVASYALSTMVHRAAVKNDALINLCDKPDNELHLEISDRIRDVRRSDYSVKALDHLGIAIGDAAARSGHPPGRETAVCAAAARILLGRNVALLGKERRLTALIVAAAAAALLGDRIHILSVDDASAKKLFENAQKFYRMFGFSAGFVEGSAPKEARRLSYQNSIVHAGALTLAADALSDLETASCDGRRLKAAVNALASPAREDARVVATGAEKLLVEDADRVLGNISARIVSIAGDDVYFEATQFADEAIILARRLSRGADYQIDDGDISLTDGGKKKAERAALEFSPIWNGDERREAVLIAALRAIELLKLDRDYTMADGAVTASSDVAAAIMEENVFDLPIRAFIEAKEGIVDTKLRRTQRAAPARAIFTSYSTIGGVATPGAQTRGEMFVALRMPTVSIDDGIEKKIVKDTTVVPTANEKYEKIACEASAYSGGAKLLIIARQQEIEPIKSAIKASPDVSLSDQMTFHSFQEACTLGADDFVGAQVIISAFGVVDEDWRYILETVFAAVPPAKIKIITDETDPVFEFLDGIEGYNFAKKFMQKFPNFFLKRALTARRARFSKFRLAQKAHYRAMDRVLAAAGDPRGGEI